MATIAGERRHLTALFCDLVDSTAISAHLDPEQWHEIAEQYQRRAAEAVTKVGGYVAKYLGDGLVVYFGYPQAQEDAAERAVRAGLAILETMTALNAKFAHEYKVKLQVRVGIHTGSVVVAQGGGNEADMFGDAPNIASRVQTAAEPDTVVITSAVHDLVSGLFVVQDRGTHQLRGIEQPVQLYRVASAGLASGHARGFALREPTPFVGRGDEAHLLMSRWERVREGEGQLVLVMGEPGIGKTRLMDEFRARIKGDPHLWIECGGAPFFASTPFHAVTQMLNQGLGWRGDETPEERVNRLERALEATKLKTAEAVPLIAEMLNLPIPDKYPPLNLVPEQKRKRLLAALSEWVFSANQPLVLVVEDLHWVDPSTLEMLQTLAAQGVTTPLLLLCTARPEFRAPWPMRAHHAQITLNRLSSRETRELVTRVIARAGLASEVVEAVILRTDGVPLFAEELTRLMLEGDGRTRTHEIPATLLDSLGARLDRLGQAKEVAQLAAVLGREFSYELFRAIAPMPEDALQGALVQLADAELIYARGIPPDASYQFKHALIQDAAYETLLKSTRRELHARIAQTMTSKFPVLADEQPQVLARHWTEAGEAELALAAWLKAAATAHTRHAFKEAEGDYRQALAMLGTLPDTPERDARELEIASAFIGVLHVTKGLGSPEAVALAARCRALAEKGGNVGQHLAALFRTWRVIWVTGEYHDALLLADEMFDLARRDGNDAYLGMAHIPQFITRTLVGDLIEAEKHFLEWQKIWRAGRHAQKELVVLALCWAGFCAWALGRLDTARDRLAEANAYARDNKNPYDVTTAKMYESLLQVSLREPVRAEEAAMMSISVSEELGFQQTAPVARAYLGWARVQLGKMEEGIAMIHESIVRLRELGTRIGDTHYHNLLAESLTAAGADSDALAVLAEALVANPEERLFRPECLLWRGELQRKLGQEEKAEADFREAITLARALSAITFELRATVKLARMLQMHGEAAAGRELLAPLYASFTEGFDSVDLKEAKALLDQLV